MVASVYSFLALVFLVGSLFTSERKAYKVQKDFKKKHQNLYI